jgi:hypothetical protein
LFTADLFGTGTARLNLALSGNRYVPDEAASLSFKFESAAAAATPEPGSLVLLGDGDRRADSSAGVSRTQKGGRV